jgi:hypothetical protein
MRVVETNEQTATHRRAIDIVRGLNYFFILAGGACQSMNKSA